MKICMLCVIWVISIFLNTGNSTDNQKAESLYNEACLLIKNTTTVETIPYSELLESYTSALEKIDLMLSDYPSSEIAYDFSTRTMRIGGYQLDELREKVAIMKLLPKARKDLFACTLMIAQIEDRRSSSSNILTEITEKLIEAGQLEVALAFVNANEYKGTRGRLFVDIAKKYAETGQLEKAQQVLSQAIETIETVDNENTKYSIYTNLAEYYVETGQFSEALETANKILDSKQKARAICQIASAYAKAGNLSEAVETGNTIEDAYCKACAFSQIAQKYIDDGQNEKAQQMLDQAQKSGMLIEDMFWKSRTLKSVATQYIDIGLLPQAIEITKYIEHENYHAKALSIVSIKYAETGRFTEALEMGKSIEYKPYRFRTLGDIAVKLIETGQNEQAESLFSEIYEGVMKIEKPDEKIWGLASLAVDYSESKNDTQAGALIPQILPILPTVEDHIVRCDVISYLIVSYIGKDQFSVLLDSLNTIEDVNERASQLAAITYLCLENGYLSQAWEIAELIRVVKIKALTLVNIADKYMDSGQSETALQLISQALEYKDNIEPCYEKSHLLGKIPVLYAKAGLLSQALDMAKSIEDRTQKVSALADIAILFDNAGQQLSKEDLANLDEIVNAVYPIKYIWGEYMYEPGFKQPVILNDM